MTKFSHNRIHDLKEDSKIFQLLKEIAQVTQFPLHPYLSNPHSMVIHYLIDYRKRRAITKDSLDAIPFSETLLLKQKIKKLHETEIYWLCNEIAQLKRSGVEKISGKTLYVFLDEYLNPKKKPAKQLLPGYILSQASVKKGGDQMSKAKPAQTPQKPIHAPTGNPGTRDTGPKPSGK